jgi:hypothetical protein
MRIQVDIKRSLAAKRIVPVKLGLSQKFSVAVYVFLASLFLFTILVFPANVILSFSREDDLRAALVVLIVFVGPSLYLIYGLVRDNKFIEGRGGLDTSQNIQAMVSVLKKRYQTDMIYGGEQMISYYRRSTFWRFSLRIIILFEQDHVYVNVSRFNQNDVKSFFHAPFSERLAQSILKDFQKELRLLSGPPPA